MTLSGDIIHSVTIYVYRFVLAEINLITSYIKYKRKSYYLSFIALHMLLLQYCCSSDVLGPTFFNQFPSFQTLEKQVMLPWLPLVTDVV